MYSISYINRDKHRTDKHEGGHGAHGAGGGQELWSGRNACIGLADGDCLMCVLPSPLPDHLSHLYASETRKKGAFNDKGWFVEFADGCPPPAQCVSPLWGEAHVWTC
jgi:hypothetical protein